MATTKSWKIPRTESRWETQPDSNNWFLEGPTAIAFGYGDISQLAKTFSDHVRTSKMNLSVRAVSWVIRYWRPPMLPQLRLPPKEVLIGKVVGSIKSRLYAAGVYLSHKGLQNVLTARIKQMEANN